jgi:plasmid stabilization system protein ParE
MKVVYTAAALGDLAEIAEWLSVHYPAIGPAVERRIRQVVSMIERWPESARARPNAQLSGSRRSGGIRTRSSTASWPIRLKSCIFLTLRDNPGTTRSRESVHGAHADYVRIDPETVTWRG